MTNKIAPSALTHGTVRLGRDIFIDELCVIGSVPCHTPIKFFDKLKGVSIGDGTYIYSGSHVVRGRQQDTVIGDNCIIGQLCVIGHDSIIGNGVRIMNSCSLNGWVKVGDNSFIGTGSVIRNRITVGLNCYIGQGSNVVKDIPDNSFGYGNPFKVVKQTDNFFVFNAKRIIGAFE